MKSLEAKDRFAVAAIWARRNGLDPTRVRESLKRGTLPGLLIGRRWVVDQIGVEQMLMPPDKPAA